MRKAGKVLVRLVVAATFTGLACLVAFLLVVGWWNRELDLPYKGYLEPEVVVGVPRGEPLNRIASRLEEAGIIRSAELLRLYYRVSPGAEHLKAGDYRFSGPVSLREVISMLSRGEAIQNRVTIPEGYDLVQIMVAFIQSGYGSVEGFGQAITRTDLIADLDPEARDLEGYLLPDTYLLPPEAGETEIIQAMVGNFRGFWTEDRRARAQELGMTVRQVVTLASLIEKETGLAEERPLVSAVFHNRLRLGMKLACDPTVVYAVRTVKEYDGIIHQSDLRLDSPYNTYLYPGLPPGPIASPGAKSIDAALYPAESDHLFFVSRNDGSHYFSSSYRDHAQAVQRYQR